jgi:hypothetical protein
MDPAREVKQINFKLNSHRIPKCLIQWTNTGCPKNGILTVHYGVEEITVNVTKMFKKYLLDLFADLAVFESGTLQVNYFEIYVWNCHGSYLSSYILSQGHLLSVHW